MLGHASHNTSLCLEASATSEPAEAAVEAVFFSEMTFADLILIYIPASCSTPLKTIEKAKKPLKAKYKMLIFLLLFKARYLRTGYRWWFIQLPRKRGIQIGVLQGRQKLHFVLVLSKPLSGYHLLHWIEKKTHVLRIQSDSSLRAN